MVMMTSVYLFIPLIIIVNVNPQDNNIPRNTLSRSSLPGIRPVDKQTVNLLRILTRKCEEFGINSLSEDLKAFNGFKTESSLSKTLKDQFHLKGI